ncbi:MAG: response regulator transcription factor [Hyphomicrobiales bacterium]
MRVLFVEDDHILGSAVRDHIIAEGHSVDWFEFIKDAEHAAKTVDYELILLDLGLPDGNGLDLLRHLRQNGDLTPIIITTAQDQVAVRIDGLNSGADDYMVKPFDLGELSARLTAVARRYNGVANNVKTLGDIDIDFDRKIVTKAAQLVALTAREWAVLDRLMRNVNAIVSKDDIETSLYAFGAEVASNAVEVYVSRLRKKLGKNIITTIRGMGYQING